MDSANGVSAPARMSRPAPSNLIQRVLSAMVLLPALAIGVWLGGIWVILLASLATLVGLYELYGIFASTGHRPRRLGYLYALLFIVAAAARPYVEADLTGLALVVVILASLIAEMPRHDRSDALLSWSLTLVGALYLGWCMAHFVLLRQITHALAPAPFSLLRLDSGAAWIMMALLITFASDTSAFFVGRAVGRHRLAPYISPKKSWEGAAGGLLGAVATGALLVPLLGLPSSVGAGALIGGLGSLAGQAGDLAESLIKRQAGVKDSGHIIPGHGGLLDRADSLLFTAPVVYYLARWLTA